MNPLPPPPNKTLRTRTAAFVRLSLPFPAGVLEIREGGRTYRYAVRGDGDGHYRLTKPGGAERYWVDPATPLCDCTGFLQYGYCKHVEAIRALTAEGQFDLPSQPS